MMISRHPLTALAPGILLFTALVYCDPVAVTETAATHAAASLATRTVIERPPRALDPAIVREYRTDPEASSPDIEHDEIGDEVGDEVGDARHEASDLEVESEGGVDLATGGPPRPETDPELDEVVWVTTEEKTAGEQASAWGVRLGDLLEYNPELELSAEEKKKRARAKAKGATYRAPKIPVGTALVVFRKNPDRPTRSIGAPNRGRLVSGIPLPEGPHWQLRDKRRRTFGTHKTITSLLVALREFGERYPDGPRVRIGELAQRRGGRIYPHRSHRTGRDVDIGYLKLNDDPERKTFRRTTRKNFDAERNWALVHALIKTGNVQAIYMNSRIQRMLIKEAKKHLSEEELRRYFQYPWHDDSYGAVIRHQNGHKNHLHVRFRCEDWNRRCRARSRQKLKKKQPKPNA